MGLVLITIKIMPESPSTNLENIRKETDSLLKKEGATSISFEEKPIAFGLKAIFARISMPEERGSDIIETTVAKIKGVSSVTIEDYGRAFG